MAERREKLTLNKSYAQWREMAGSDPDMARKMGFRDDPARDGKEMLSLSLETVPLWKPGFNMRGGRFGKHR